MVAGIIAVLALAGIFPSKEKESSTETTTANSDTKGEPTETRGTTGTDNQPSQDGTGSSDNKDPGHVDQPATGEKPKTPDGNFVSAHRVSLSASPTLQSSCTTTAGATCQVIFIKDGVIKSLEAKKTDAGGGAYWTWSLEDAGLSVGSWKIQLKATLGSQTATAEDSLNLEVSS